MDRIVHSSEFRDYWSRIISADSSFTAEPWSAVSECPISVAA